MYQDPVSPMASDHEVVSDNYSPVETNNMENSAVSKEPAEAQTSVVHVDEQASDKMTGNLIIFLGTYAPVIYFN